MTVIAWWLAVSLLGLAALPLTHFTLRHLPDRGYAVSRLLGLLLTSFVAWLAGHRLGWTGAIGTGVLALLLLSAFFARGLWRAQWRFMREHVSYVLLVELIFFATLAGAAGFKSTVGAINETEKPADFTLLHGIMTSPTMPPHDPWLSGPPISYYYFGYYIVALVAKVTGTPAGVAFNMGLALIFALTALAGVGLGYALTRRMRYGLLLAFALTLMGNLDYWFRVPQVFRLGDLNEKYLLRPDNPAMKAGMAGVFEYLVSPLSHGWGYYHASRLIDVGAVTKNERLITEFPAFSFFLGDLHPHVMALPFFVLTLCLSLSLLRAPLPGWGAFGSRWGWRIAQFAVLSVAYGSLGFLNSWDFPTVMLVLAACLALREVWASGGITLRSFGIFASVGLPLAVAAFAIFTPFYRTLQTQLKGLAIVAQRTDIYYWPFLFGPFLLVLVPALVERARGARKTSPGVEPAEKDRLRKKARAGKPAQRQASAGDRQPDLKGPRCVLCGTPADAAVCPQCGGEVVPPWLSAELPHPGLRSALAKVGGWLSGTTPALQRVLVGAVVILAAFDLLSGWNPAVTVLSLLLAALALTSLGARNDGREGAFASLLAALGLAIIVACEWVYFVDVFSVFPHLARMNTMFKFYYQAWVLLAAGATGLLPFLLRWALPRWPKPARQVWGVLAAIVAVATVAYPLAAWSERVQGHNSPANALDGTEHFRATDPDDARAVDWLRDAAPKDGSLPVVLEAWGRSFTTYGRVATYSAFPTIVGWEGHEEQWRGGQLNVIRGGIDADDTVRKRYEDVDRLYESPDLDETRALLRRYGVRYVYVGALERAKNQGSLDKWETLGERVYQAGGVTIYSVKP